MKSKTRKAAGKASLDPLVGRKLAIRIARSIFTPTGGRHKRVSRIALMRDGKDLCGWGFWEAVEQIRKTLVRANEKSREQKAVRSNHAGVEVE